MQMLADRTAALQDQSRHEEMYAWLAAPDSSIKHNAARKIWVKSTGHWFLKSQQYADWKAAPHSLMWLHGIPGCGKTILSSTIIDDMQELCAKNQGSALACFYFDFNDTQSYCGKMLRSLVSQLSLQNPAACSLLHELYISCKGSLLTDEALLAALKDMLVIIPQSYFVLDALDECQSREIILEAIEYLSTWQLDGLHTLVTSRQERDLKESLESLTDESCIIDLHRAVVDEDIRTYIRSQLNHKPALRRWKQQPEAQAKIERSLMEKADVTFARSCLQESAYVWRLT